MAKDKERQVNPATAALKAAKNRTITKQKAAVAAQRNERLSKRNPDRVRQQIEDLKQQREASGGVLNARDRKRLEELERDVVRIERVREKDAGAGGGGGADKRSNDGAARAAGEQRRDVRQEQRDRRLGVLGKRGRDDASAATDHDNNDVNGFKSANKRQRTPESSTDDEARNIPMPQDTENMPPIPRRPQRHSITQHQRHELPNRPGQGEVPLLPAQTVYSSAPQLRDLHKEAVSRFVPAAVASKLAAVKGEGGKLLEPEEADALEAAGYSSVIQQKKQTQKDQMTVETEMDEMAEKVVDEADKEIQYRLMAREAEDGATDSLEEEARRFEQELRTVEMEEVPDEDL